MAMLAERERLEKERHLHELEMQQKQLAHLLERCNSYATQATLVTGFAFTSFSADALADLDYSKAPVRSFAFVLTGAVTMSLSIGAVVVASFLTGTAERLAMEVDVRTAVALVRWRMRWVEVPYTLSLIFLFLSAGLLVLATCTVDSGMDVNGTLTSSDDLCELNGILVFCVFITFGAFLTLFPRWRITKDVANAYRAAGVTWDDQGPPQLREPMGQGLRSADGANAVPLQDLRSQIRQQ
jgi:hypothetical protein